MTDMVSRSVGRLGSHHADAATSGPFIESSMNPRISSCVGSQRAGELIPPYIRIFVSVSAMPPCTQSFIPLSLPHEYNLNDMIASKRYESVWNTFLKELTRDSAVTLYSLQKKWHVNRIVIKQLMRNNELSIKEHIPYTHESF